MIRSRSGHTFRVVVTGALAATALLVAGAASAEGFGQLQQSLTSGFQMLTTGSSLAAAAAVGDLPEPGSLALLGIAVAGLLVARRRK